MMDFLKDFLKIIAIIGLVIGLLIWFDLIDVSYSAPANIDSYSYQIQESFQWSWNSLDNE